MSALSAPVISLADYHAALAISPSKLKFWRDNQRTPERYASKYILRTVKPESKGEAFVIGQLTEDITQRGEIGPEFVAKAFDSYRSKEAQAWRDSIEAEGKTIYTAEQLEKAQACAAVALSNPVVAMVQARAEQQRTFRATLSGGVILQCRPDWWLPQGLDGMSDPLAVDLKTCEDINDFDADIFKWGYHWAAHLTRFLAGHEIKRESGASPEIGYAWAVVDKHDSPVCHYVRCTEGHMSIALIDLEDERDGLLHGLIARYRSSDWTTPTERDAILPRWAERKASA